MPRIRPYLRTKASRKVVGVNELNDLEVQQLNTRLRQGSGAEYRFESRLDSLLRPVDDAESELIGVDTYTPTIGPVGGAGTSINTLNFTRFGDIVHVFGNLNYTPPSAGAWTEFNLSLPVATTFSNIDDASGAAQAWTHDVGCAFRADTTNNVLHGRFYAVDTVQHEFASTFFYKVA